MMQLSIAIIITGIAIGLLAIYGADVAIGYSSADNQGFLQIDHKSRGIGLGVPALVLPIVAYFIARKNPSKPLGIMIIVAGILIITGGAVVIGNAEPSEINSNRNVLAETVPLLIIGGIQIALGIIKIKKSKVGISQ